MKYFLHGFIRGFGHGPAGSNADTIFVVEIQRWTIKQGGFEADTNSIRIWNGFDPGNRYYIVGNNGQCQEPNGDIIWRWENGGQGDEKAAA